MRKIVLKMEKTVEGTLQVVN